MSLNEIRRIKLLKDLQNNNRHHSKSEVKRKFHSTMSATENLRKLNKNKKYMLEEERNTQIERNNRLLYQKIMGHFQNLKETIQSRNKWRKKKRKVQIKSQEDSAFEFNLKRQPESQIKFRSRVQTLKDSKVNEVQTLFFGVSEIDGCLFRIKLLLSRQGYRLLAQNKKLKIELDMQYQQYMKLQKQALQGNPCNIFKYLEIVGDTIQFKQQTGKTKTLV